MTNRKIAGLFVLMIAAISWPALADTFAPSHACTQPIKPDQFDGNQQVDMFNDDVAEYKQCIAVFADEQNQAAGVHRRAASEAIDEWNTFVSDSDLD